MLGTIHIDFKASWKNIRTYHTLYTHHIWYMIYTMSQILYNIFFIIHIQVRDLCVTIRNIWYVRWHIPSFIGAMHFTMCGILYRSYNLYAICYIYIINDISHMMKVIWYIVYDMRYVLYHIYMMSDIIYVIIHHPSYILYDIIHHTIIWYMSNIYYDICLYKYAMW